MDKDRRANFLRKLHSFAGVFPLGIFLCFHMCVNYSANWGTTPYDTMGSFMAHMPYKVVLETFVIFLPLLFHALYGVYISLTSSVTVKRYRYFRNWCYVLQRIAGIVTLLFVIWHIYFCNDCFNSLFQNFCCCNRCKLNLPALIQATPWWRESLPRQSDLRCSP